VKFVRRAAIRLERGCLLGIEPRAGKLALEEWAHPVSFLSGSPLFARLSDCPATVKVAGSLRRLGGGEKRVTQKLEIARRHTSDATSQSSDFPVSCQVTWPFLLAIPVSFLCLAGPCLAGGGPAWRPACWCPGPRWPGPGGRLAGWRSACCGPAWAWQASHSTQHTLTKLTLPLTSNEVNLGVCSQNSHSPSSLIPVFSRLGPPSAATVRCRQNTHMSHSPTPLSVCLSVCLSVFLAIDTERHGETRRDTERLVGGK
jgi:hypothetical protein